MQDITGKQEQILDYVRKQIAAKGQTPTVREIGLAVGLSSSCSVKKHLDVLVSKGFLKRDRYKRSLDLMEDGTPLAMGRAVGVPLKGRVAAGALRLAEDDPDAEILAVPAGMLSRSDQNGKDLFALEVTGESMHDAGITDGDVIIVRRQETARDGDIVVALVENEGTVKTFYKERDHIRLQPENSAYEPILSRDVVIKGKVVLAIKRF